MPQQLLIRIQTEPDQATWGVLDAGGKLMQHGLGLSSVPATGSYQSVDVLVPGNCITCTEVVVPTTQRGQLVQAVPFALEDQLAADLDEIHVAVGEQRDDGHVPAVAVDRELMERWLEMLRSVGIDALRILPEPLVLAPNSVVVEAEQATFRVPGLAGAAEPDLLEVIIGKSALSPDQLEVTDLTGAGPEGFLSFLGAGLDRYAPVNLLQGAFARHSVLQAWWQQWRWAAVFAIAAIGGLMAREGVSIWQLNKASAVVLEQSQQALNDVFPEAPVTDNPRQQMRQSMAQLRASKGLGNDGGLLALLKEVGPSIAQDTRVQLDEVEFRNEQLEIQLTFASVEALDRFRNRLQSNSGLTVEVLSATTGADGVMGRLRIVSAGRTT